MIDTDRPWRSRRRALVLMTLAAVGQLLSIGCGGGSGSTVPGTLDGAVCPFDIHWPPRDPQEDAPQSAKPLLRGMLFANVEPSSRAAALLRLSVTLNRPSDEPDRQTWNSKLAYADIDWMDEVRVWDADGKWLWPNLPYLLRLPGQERIERYGGMDPGKHVDNDFAAVLIRKFDASGKVESDETRDAPLVSAEWHAQGVAESDPQTIVHGAKSDEFLLHLGDAQGADRGVVKVWLIYADFFGARPPRTWPREREWAGGILAYFQIDWEVSDTGGLRGSVCHQRPGQSTGFDWADWAQRTR